MSAPAIENLEIIQDTENIGFSRAINAAANARDEKYLLFLNPDCELLPGSLEYLKEALEKDSSAALAGPLVVDRQGNVQKGTLRRFPDPWKSFLSVTGLWRLGRIDFPPSRVWNTFIQSLPESTTAAEAVSGACMLVRREPFMDCGGMDEEYGLHCEDLDLMYRFRTAGTPLPVRACGACDPSAGCFFPQPPIVGTPPETPGHAAVFQQVPGRAVPISPALAGH